MAKNPVGLTDKEARDLGGNNLHVPEDAKATPLKAKWAEDAPEPLFTYIWSEVCVIDNVKWDGEPTKPGSQEPSEYTDLDHEKFTVMLRVSSFHPSENQGRVIADFNDFIWGLRFMSQEEMKQNREVLPDGDVRKTYYGRRFGLEANCRKMASFFQATGMDDRLSGRGKRKFFKGFESVMDVLPAIIGKEIVVTFKQSPQKNGGLRDDVIDYKAAE